MSRDIRIPTACLSSADCDVLYDQLACVSCEIDTLRESTACVHEIGGVATEMGICKG